MTATQWILIGVVCVPLAFVIANRLRIDLAALLMAVTLGSLQLFGFGMLGPAHTPAAAGNIVSGFGQPIILILISLFILTQVLEKSGVTRWIAQRLIRLGGNNQSRLIALFTGITAFFSLFMNNLAAGALVLPIAMEAARRTRISPSKLLIPVAYGSLLGGAATYFTTANIIVSSLLTSANPPQTALHILDFTPTGSLIAIAGILFFGFFGKRLLPDRKPSVEQSLARLSGNELEELYALGNRLWAGRIDSSSPLVNQTLKMSGIGGGLGILIVAMHHKDHAFFVPTLTEVLQPNDVLLIVGREERVFKLAEKGVHLKPEKHTLTTFGLTLTELTPTPRSSCIGKNLKEMNFRAQYNFAAIALLRGQRSFRTDVADIPIKAGDSLLIVGPQDRIRDLHRSADFIVFEPNLSDLPVDGKMAISAVAIVAAAIAATIAGAPVELAMLSAAVLCFLLGRVSMEEGYRIVEWQAVFLIAGMYVVSDAMVETRLADLLGTGMLKIVEPIGPLGLAAGAYILTAFLTQIMGGQVTALVTGPVTISAAIHMGVSPQAIAAATAIGCSASFFTPLAHPVNIMMIAPGNYTFGDFFRSGWPLTILSFVMLMLGMILFWRL
ncbi:MAG TPA: SLC13 family permease [Anaerolineales bacterium]|nr:SLC13 family permease [Anaerolineales bacterium]